MSVPILPPGEKLFYRKSEGLVKKYRRAVIEDQIQLGRKNQRKARSQWSDFSFCFLSGKVTRVMMNNRFEYTKTDRDGVIVFTLSGSLDIGTVATMKADLDSLLSIGQHNVVFELSDLEQIDSSGIGAIIALFKRVRTNKGMVKIARLVGQPKEIFSLLRLDRVFEIHSDVEAALKSFH